jgi:hypothetical protein
MAVWDDRHLERLDAQTAELGHRSLSLGGLPTTSQRLDDTPKPVTLSERHWGRVLGVEKRCEDGRLVDS